MTRQKTDKKVIGQSMLKLLTEKEKKVIAGGPKGDVRPPQPNPTGYVHHYSPPSKR